MKITIESTSRMVEVVTQGGATIAARIWQGTNEDGDPVVCLITRIAPAIPINELPQEVADRFARSLKDASAPTAAAVQAFPLRMVL